MKHILSSDKGFTLIEVMLTLIISVIISGTIYSLFITGLNLYQKIQVEGQIRDDADYVATLLLNELTENQPRYVTNLPGKNGIRLKVVGTKNVQGFLIEDNTNITNIDIYYEDSQFHIIKENVEVLVLDSPSSLFIDLNAETKTGITLETGSNCTKDKDAPICTHGIIHLTMVMEDKNHSKGSLLNVKPLVLESSFGF